MRDPRPLGDCIDAIETAADVQPAAATSAAPTATAAVAVPAVDYAKEEERTALLGAIQKREEQVLAKLAHVRRELDANKTRGEDGAAAR